MLTFYAIIVFKEVLILVREKRKDYELIMIDSRKKNCNSEIIDNFSEITLKAYISLFYKCGIKK